VTSEPVRSQVLARLEERWTPEPVGCFVEDKNLLVLSEIKPQLHGCTMFSVVTIITMLSYFLSLSTFRYIISEMLQVKVPGFNDIYEYNLCRGTNF